MVNNIQLNVWSPNQINQNNCLVDFYIKHSLDNILASNKHHSHIQSDIYSILHNMNILFIFYSFSMILKYREYFSSLIDIY